MFKCEDTLSTEIYISEHLYERKRLLFITDEKNETWFREADIAVILDGGDILPCLVDDGDILQAGELKVFDEFSTINQPLAVYNVGPGTTFIHEVGLRRILAAFKKPTCENHLRWLFADTGRIQTTINAEKFDRWLLWNRKDIQTTANLIKKVVIKPKNEDFWHYFMLLKLNDDKYGYAYYVIRRQKISSEIVLARVKSRHPNFELLSMFYDSNPVNFYSRVKEQLKDVLHVHGNYFKIINSVYSEKKLVDDIQKLRAVNMPINSDALYM